MPEVKHYLCTECPRIIHTDEGFAICPVCFDYARDADGECKVGVPMEEMVVGTTKRKASELKTPLCRLGLGAARPKAIIDEDGNCWEHRQEDDTYVLWALQGTLLEEQ